MNLGENWGAKGDYCAFHDPAAARAGSGGPLQEARPRTGTRAIAPVRVGPVGNTFSSTMIGLVSPFAP